MTHDDVLEKAVLGLFVSPSGTNRPSLFLSTLYCSLRQQWDESIPSACVDARMRLRINPTWFMTLSSPMRETLLAHEIWHVALLHIDPSRMGNRCPDKWNQACDYAINLMLHEHGFTFDRYPADHPKAGEIIGLLDERFKDMSAEEIYDILEAEGGKPFLPFGNDFEVGSADADGAAGTGGASRELTAEERNEIVSNIVRAMNVSRMSSKETGLLPGQLTTMIDDLLNPRLPWDALLRRWLTERSEYGATWRKPSRRFDDIYMPGRTGQEGLAHLRWYLDCSGSVSDAQLQVYTTEMAGAKAMHNPERMTVTSFDTRLRDTWEFTLDEELPPLEFTGRGGTCLVDVFADIQKHKPNAAIIVSDLYVGIPPNPGIPILWICVDHPEATVPYGTIVHLDSSIYDDR